MIFRHNNKNKYKILKTKMNRNYKNFHKIKSLVNNWDP